jgi:ubiquinone/menaquinone biosynthesis C-methylase UbiE
VQPQLFRADALLGRAWFGLGLPLQPCLALLTVHRDLHNSAEVAVLETFVVPRYLSAFGTVALDMMLVGEGANVVHVGCRTGYPDRLLLERVPGARVTGVDTSSAAIELARNKAATSPEGGLNYVLTDGYPTHLEPGSFSHALTLHPIGTAFDRTQLFSEMMRLVYTEGQVLVSMPLRGSFQELGDLFREFALKYDQGEFGQAVEFVMANRPSIETLSEELESVGLEDVDVEVVSTELTFAGGRAFIEDPTTRLLILPELQTTLGNFDLTVPMSYVCDAVDAYFAEGEFALSVKIGCASARRP